jgi:two-component system, OmpR family, response regulator
VPEQDRILVVDDEPYITDLLTAGLQFEGFAVEVASTGSEAMEKVRSTRPDLVLLDVMLPDIEGLDVARRWRDEGEAVPVLFLTARDSTEDKLTGLAIGDDYVTKPFSMSEVVARIRAVLRRSRDDGEEVRSQLRFADLVMDTGAREVWRHGQPVDLTATEFKLLEFLLDNARRVVPKYEILDQVWGYEFEGDPNIVETYISYLRKKIDEFDPALIHTVRGVGYALRLPRP